MRFKSAASLLAFVFLIKIVSSASNSSNNQNNNNNLCQNAWKYPPNCQGNCTYQLVWRFRPQDDSIEFIVSSRHALRWTGVGFSQDKSLRNADAIFAWIEENSRYVMMDAFLPQYTTPISDKLQSISNISATTSNGLISFRFIRKRNTGDIDEDLMFSDERCLYLIYPVEGGSVDFKNRAVATDEYPPIISDQPICIRACNYKPPQAASSTAAPQPAPGRPQLHFPSPQRPNIRQTSTTPAPVGRAQPPRLAPSLSPATTTSTSTTLAPSSSSTLAPSSSTTSSTTTTSTTSSTTTTSTTTSTTPKPTPSSSTTSTSTSTTTTTTTARPTTTSTSTTSTTTTSTTVAPTSSSSTTTTSTSLAPLVERVSSFVTTNAPLSDGQPQQQWCAGRWLHPPGCRFHNGAAAATLAYLQQPIDNSLNIKPLPLDSSDCTYLAQWQYLEPSDSIDFIIQTKTRNKWTGIGFGNTTRMANSDAIIGIIEEQSGRHFIMDTWLKDHVMPEIDLHQNTDTTRGKRENGVTTVSFRRKRLTGDLHDFQFTDDSCAYFFFPTQGGSFNAISKRMHKHEVNPSVSKQRICVKSCTRAQTLSSTSTSTTTLSSSILADSPTSQPEAGEPSSSSSSSFSSVTTSQSPNLLLLSSSSSPSPSTSLGGNSVSSSSVPNLMGAPEKNPDTTSSVGLAPSNDLSAELDSVSTSSTSASSNHNSNLFNKLAFLSEPSLRWLAGIGSVAILLAVIVFQACFTLYKNKQACKQNMYRQSAFKQNAYLHGAYLADHQTSTNSGNSSEDNHTTSASLQASAAVKLADVVAQSVPARSRAAQARPRPGPAASRPLVPPAHPFAAQSRAAAAYTDHFATPSATESSEQDEDGLEEVDEEEEEVEDDVEGEEEDEEEDEGDYEGEYEDDMMVDDSFDYNHRLAYHNHSRHPYHAPHPGAYHPHPHQHPHQHPQHHHHHHPHAHPHSHQQAVASQHHHRTQAAAAHYRQPSHYHPVAGQQNLQPSLHRAHLPTRSQPQHQTSNGNQATNQQSRPDSYFLPSQRRY